MCARLVRYEIVTLCPGLRLHPPGHQEQQHQVNRVLQQLLPHRQAHSCRQQGNAHRPPLCRHSHDARGRQHPRHWGVSQDLRPAGGDSRGQVCSALRFVSRAFPVSVGITLLTPDVQPQAAFCPRGVCSRPRAPQQPGHVRRPLTPPPPPVLPPHPLPSDCNRNALLRHVCVTCRVQTRSARGLSALSRQPHWQSGQG